MTSSITITPARRDDLAALLKLERAGFDAAEQWSERSWLGELLAQDRTILLARAHQLAGAIVLKTVDASADLHRLAVAPAHRRQGVATALVLAGLQAVRHLRVTSVILEVGFSNEAAIRLYQGLGFEQLAARPDYYGPGKHALILKRYDLQASV